MKKSFEEGYKESTRSNWYKLGEKSLEDKKELIYLVKDFLQKPVNEKTKMNIPAYKNKVCWKETKRELIKLCEEQSNIVHVVGKHDDLTIKKYPPRVVVNEEATENGDLDAQMEEMKLEDEEETQEELIKRTFS